MSLIERIDRMEALLRQIAQMLEIPTAVLETVSQEVGASIPTGRYENLSAPTPGPVMKPLELHFASPAIVPERIQTAIMDYFRSMKSTERELVECWSDYSTRMLTLKLPLESTQITMDGDRGEVVEGVMDSPTPHHTVFQTLCSQQLGQDKRGILHFCPLPKGHEGEHVMTLPGYEAKGGVIN